MNDRDLLRACAIARRGDCPDVMQDIEELPSEIESDHRYARSLEERAQWQPIETAPKDGTYVVLRLFHRLEGAAIGRWFGFGQVIHGRSGFWEANATEVGPTHWMPLPEEPPK